MKKATLAIIILSLVCMLGSCKVIDTVTNDLEMSGYDVVLDEENSTDEYVMHKVYDGDMFVAYIIEFPSFRKARAYYDEHYEEEMDATWVIHNQLIISTHNQDVIDIIVNS